MNDSNDFAERGFLIELTLKSNCRYARAVLAKEDLQFKGCSGLSTINTRGLATVHITELHEICIIYH